MNFREFEDKIGYKFQKRELLERALTHSSYNRKKNTKHQDNERMEFLGDAFLDAIISVQLFARMADVTEGKLTKTRALIVCEKALAEVAHNYNLGKYMNLYLFYFPRLQIPFCHCILIVQHFLLHLILHNQHLVKLHL